MSSRLLATAAAASTVARQPSAASKLLAGAVTAAAVSYVAYQRGASRAASSSAAGVPFSSFSVLPRTLQLLAPLDDGFPSEELGVHFDVVSAAEPLVVTPESLGADRVLVKLLAVSADPYQRGRIRSRNMLTGAQRAPGPAPMTGFVSGKILASRHPKWRPGDLFGASLPITTVQVVDLSRSDVLIWPLKDIDESQVSLGVGVLGMPGATAYGGLIGCLRPKEGETLYVSGAAGAVGSLVGEMGKNLFNLTVIGSCGGEDKGRMIKERHGYDVAIDRRTLPQWGEGGDWSASKVELQRRLKEAAPNGISMYFDNVGADHFEAAFDSLGPGGRIAVCGQIASYNDASTPAPRIFPGKMIYSKQRIEGILSLSWLQGTEGNFHDEMPRWLQEGKVTPHETQFEGLGSWPAAFRSLFTGTETKQGKVVVMLQGADFEGEQVQPPARL